MADTENCLQEMSESKVISVKAPDPEAAESQIRGASASAFVIVVEADTDSGSWHSRLGLETLLRTVHDLRQPAILIARGRGHIEGLLSEAFDLCYFEEDVILLTENGALQAAEAEEKGRINLAGHRDAVVQAAYRNAETIASLAPLAVRTAKRAVREGAKMGLGQGMELENRSFSGLFCTRDMREGTAAFLEKRAPVFRGK